MQRSFPLLCLLGLAAAACAPSKPAAATAPLAEATDADVGAEAAAPGMAVTPVDAGASGADDAIERALATANPKLEECRSAGLKRVARLSGHVKVKLHVDAHGAVVQVEDLGSKVNDAATVACFVAALKALTLPADHDAYEVVKTYTILPPPDVWPTAGGKRP